MRYDVITVGAATRDVFVRSAAFEVREDAASPSGEDTCFPLGAKIEIEELTQETGGGATNAAVTFARLGHKTAVISAIGQDDNGHAVISALKKEGVETRLIEIRKREETGYSIIILTGSGERTILVRRGASDHLSIKHLPWSTMKAKWIYVSSVGGDIGMLRRVFREAKRAGVRIAWNPGGKEIAHGFSDLKPLIAQTDLFVVNLEEAMKLLGQTEHDPVMMLCALRGSNKRFVVITDGEHGAYAAEDGAAWHVASLVVKLQNMTGAGDAFGSGMVAGLMQKDDLRHALAVGIHEAGSVVESSGAKVGLLRKYPTPTQIKKARITPIKL